MVAPKTKNVDAEARNKETIEIEKPLKVPLKDELGTPQPSQSAVKKPVSLRAALVALRLNNLYKRWIYNKFKGDPGKLTLYTLNVLLLSEVPIYFFTLLDILKLKSLFKYRLHYNKDVVEHLGLRKYPPLNVLVNAAKVSEFNFFFAYYFPAWFFMTLGNKLGIYVYETEESDEKVTWWEIIKDIALITVLADQGFYWLHRYVCTLYILAPRCLLLRSLIALICLTMHFCV